MFYLNFKNRKWYILTIKIISLKMAIQDKSTYSIFSSDYLEQQKVMLSFNIIKISYYFFIEPD
jgi:hypothetical protein